MKSWRTWVLHTTWLCTLLRFWELLNQYSSSKNKWIGCGKRWWRNRSIPFIYCGLSTLTKTRSSPCLFVLLIFVVVLAEEFLEGVKFSISREQYWNTGFYEIIISVVSESHFDNKVRRPGNKNNWPKCLYTYTDNTVDHALEWVWTKMGSYHDIDLLKRRGWRSSLIGKTLAPLLEQFVVERLASVVWRDLCVLWCPLKLVVFAWFIS